jgi:hypothetical protein
MPIGASKFSLKVIMNFMWIKSYLIKSVVFATKQKTKELQKLQIMLLKNLNFFKFQNPHTLQKLRIRLAALYSDVTP